MLTAEEAVLVEKLKNVKEWQALLEEVEQIVIAEILEHKGQSWWKVMLEIVLSATTKCTDSLIESIKGSSDIPQEFKDASVADWFSLATSVLLNQGKILSKIWEAPVAPEVPVEVPASPVV